MITLKVKLVVCAGFEREVFASCGAIVRAQLQDQVEEAVSDAVRDHGGSLPLRISLNLGNLSWATWKSDLASSALSALRRRSFTVELGRRNGPLPPAIPYPRIMPPSGISSRPAGTDHRNAVENDALEAHAVPHDGLVALAAFLEKGHFSGAPPWGGASPAAWFADELDGNARRIVEVLNHVVKQAMYYARLRHAVGAPLAARTRALCDSADVQSVDLEKAPANRSDPDRTEVGLSVKHKPANGDDASVNRRRPPPPEYHAAPRRAQRALSRAPASGTARAAEQDVIVVTNAGLICLWPLIPALLATIDLRPSSACRADALQAGTADDAQIRVSAAIALDYLVWGDPEWREWRMPVNKLVCGLPQDALIDAPMLADSNKAKIDAWLHALPPRLPGLGNCGVSDLRQLFLQRVGKLVSENARWRIEVEADASDVLLDPLPWPLQQAVLPWLTEPIEVMWR